MKIDRAKLLSSERAAEYLGISRSSLRMAVFRQRLRPAVSRGSGRRSFFTISALEAYKLKRTSTPAALDDDMVTLSQLMTEYSRLRTPGMTDSGFRSMLSRALQSNSVPSQKIHCTNSPGFRLVFPKIAAHDAIASFSGRKNTPITSNHPPAPPEILRAAKWVTCARAAQLIGCTTREISSRASKYAFPSYVHPKSKKLLVNWLNVKEAMSWRNTAFIKKVLGSMGYALVRRYCRKKYTAPPRGGVLYYVPELLSAALPPPQRRALR